MWSRTSVPLAKQNSKCLSELLKQRTLESLWYERTPLICESLYCLWTPMASKCRSSITDFYYLYNCQLQIVHSFELAFAGTFFYQTFYPSSEHESLLTYPGKNKSLEMKRSNFSPWFKGPINISSNQHTCCCT